LFYFLSICQWTLWNWLLLIDYLILLKYNSQ